MGTRVTLGTECETRLFRLTFSFFVTVEVGGVLSLASFIPQKRYLFLDASLRLELGVVSSAS